MSRILVVDDKELMRDAVSTMLTRAGWSVLGAGDGQAALDAIRTQRPSVVLTDLKMPSMSGLDLLQEIRRLDEHLPVILMTAYATVQTAVEAMKLGAYDYITKPFEGRELVQTVVRAMERAELLRENEVLKSSAGHPQAQATAAATDGSMPLLVGASVTMQTLKQQITRIAPSQSTCLIVGESGAGKEVVAQTLHTMSTRAAAPILALNCAALSSTLLESELFGHERGAFTGADRQRKGRFELADGGTLLLDEITEIPPHLQAKLLRVLQEQAFERVGSSTTQHTDVRVIATTNRDLRQAVADGDFRQDLYFRLNVLPIEVPPLRARLDDIGLLCEHFMKRLAEMHGGHIARFSEQAITLMQHYNWPGNVRELYNVCERARILGYGDVIEADVISPWLCSPCLPAPQTHPHTAEAMPGTHQQWAQSPSGPNTMHQGAPVDHGIPIVVRKAAGTNGASYAATTLVDPKPGTEHGDNTAIDAVGRTLEEIEREIIVATLKRNNSHRQKTAEELGIGVRTLGLKLRKWKDLRLVSQDL
ncbi:MAG: sigma-54-dependent Fis family transcriptional regulator [Planctomycetes bacterium]|nr:sigma-54-dependent Fis family transcriptional regulator [Planctomycetota bacterium]NOG53598.1 sigma-54-dependent Fis family transcriptional regulator [Planctomycetota bacterium]